MSNPWMPLYVADFLADTGHLDAEQTGAYMLLIMHYWRHGGLPDSDVQLSKIARLGTKKWARHRELLASFFGTDWTHKRVDAEIRKSSEKSEKARDSAYSRHKRKPVETVSERTANAHANALHPQCLSQPHISISNEIDKTREAEREFEDQFWPAWPNKADKQDAKQAYRKARKKLPIDQMLAEIERYKREKPQDRAWMHPATWLRGERWNDQFPKIQPRAGPGGRPEPGILTRLAMGSANEQSDDPNRNW